jgi:hypothetical protein
MRPTERVERRQGCALLALRAEEPQMGTAAFAPSWLLLVHHGPWAANALHGLFDPAVGRELFWRLRTLGIRPQVIRRSSARAAGQPHEALLVSARPGRTWIERVDLAEPGQVLDLDLDALAAGRVTGAGSLVEHPVYAVCTHARHDACCAQYGRPAYRTLDDLLPGRVWESSHVGGDRFAGNLIVFPEALYYGRVDPAAAERIAAAHARGDVDLPALRGRACHPQPAQAADWFLRSQTGLTGIDAVRVRAVRPADGAWSVDLTTGEGDWTARVARRPTGLVRLTTCSGTRADPGAWHLLDLAVARRSVCSVR